MLEHSNVFIALALSFTIAYFVIPKIIKVSRKIHLYDVPNHRSAAKKVVPTLGGIAIFAGFIISTIVSSKSLHIDELKYLFAGIITMFLIGLKDDIIGMPAKKKFIVQIVIALYLVILGSYRISNLHGIFGIHQIDYFTGAFISVVAIVGIINAMNLVDGIDGLAGGIGLLCSLVFGFWFIQAGDVIYALVSFSLAGSLIAFLLYNVFGNTNKIFMGDTGSLILGTIVAILVIRFNIYQPTISGVSQGLPALSLAIIIVPVIDTMRVFAIRIAQRQSPFTPDMNHIHHKILQLSGSHQATTAIILCVNASIVFCSFLLIEELGNNTLFFLILLTGFVLASIPYYLVKWMDNPKTVERGKSIILLSMLFEKFKD